MKLYHYFTLFVALTISVCAAYYSIVGLTAIFAAAVIPIIIMGGVLELAKITGAVWLKLYWREANWWIKFYLVPAVAVLMLITSMGIFGFLSKAHIEQTASAAEGVAQIERIEKEIARQRDVIAKSEQRIVEAESSVVEKNNEIQSQIDTEQQRINGAYERIQPAIDEQLAIIDAQEIARSKRVKVYEDEIAAIETELGRLNSLVEEYRTQLKNANVASVEEQVSPYLDQISQFDKDIERLSAQAAEYEERIANLSADTSAIDFLLQQIKETEDNIVFVTNQLQSTERSQVQAAQAVIGVSSDGLFGSNTRRALASWIENQQSRIDGFQAQIVDMRKQSQDDLTTERARLAALVTDLRGPQTQAIRERKKAILDTIDSIRNNAAQGLQEQRNNIQARIDTVLNVDIVENRNQRRVAQDAITAIRQEVDPRSQSAREEIARLRQGAEDQIEKSNELIQKLRDSLTIGDDADIQTIIDNQTTRITQANNTIDELTDERYKLEAEARKLEAEVGPIKYVAELIYGEGAEKNLLEKSVRWMILLLVAVFDPLAVILTLAAITGITSSRYIKKKNNNITTVEVEKIVEVEKPVEVIKEVEKIVEVEKPVEKIVEVEDTKKVNKLKTTINDLTKTIDNQKQLITKLKKDQKVRNQPIAEADIDLGDVSGASFGSTWPVRPSKGQLFLKVDIDPNKLYKWNGRKWIEVDNKHVDDTLVFDYEYIKWLITEVKHGRREFEELTDVEQQQIKNYVRVHGNNEDIR